MEERDIFWVKEVIENGEVEFNEAVFASDNPMMFRFNEYIVQADEYLYMNDSLDFTKIDVHKVLKEIMEVTEKFISDNKFVFIDKMINVIDFGEYYIDVEHNLIRK